MLIGDIDLLDENWEQLAYLSKGIIPISIERKVLTDIVFEDRKDSSDYVIRNKVDNREKFRKYILENINISHLVTNKEIKKGDILISNEKYKRYYGELEIALKNLGFDEKRDVISRVVDYDLELLKYISKFKKFILK